MNSIDYDSMKICFIILICILIYGEAESAEINIDNLNQIVFEGFIGAEIRYFNCKPEHLYQNDHKYDDSLIFEPKLTYTWNGEKDTFVFKPFYRLADNHYDPEKSHGDIRELYWLHIEENLSLRLGYIKEFWGVAESRHLVDIINQTDFLDDQDPDEKLGQPAAHIMYRRTNWGAFNVYLMPFFREGAFPGRCGRLRGVFSIDAEQPIYESDKEEKHIDYALRYANSVDRYDIGISYFSGTSREPRVTLGTDDAGRQVLLPHYDLIDQISLDLQITLNAWLLKTEAYYRTGQVSDYYSFVTGFEYTFFGIFESNTDLGLLMEYNYDGRKWEDPPTIFNKELFFGVRLSMNDQDDTSFLLGIMVDAGSGSRTVTGKFKKRFYDHWILEIDGTGFDGVKSEEMVLSSMRKDHNLKMKLKYYF